MPMLVLRKTPLKHTNKDKDTIPDVLEVRMSECLLSSESGVRVVSTESCDEVNTGLAAML